MQILRVEKRRLTIALMYGIITAEKEFLRSRILDFLTAFWSHRKELDHTFDHLRLRTTWKQCLQEHPKAPISDSKVPKSLVNQAKNRLFSVWEHDVAGSNPVIPNILALKSNFQSLFLCLSHRKIWGLTKAIVSPLWYFRIKFYFHLTLLWSFLRRMLIVYQFCGFSI